MTCSGAYTDADGFAQYWCITIDEEDEARLNRFLRMAATRIHAARSASGGCDCALAEWAADYLAELNILIAVTTYICKCTNLNLTADQIAAYLDAVQNDLTLIREGKTELCAGETGADFPAFDYAEMTWTTFATEEILENEVLRRND